MNVVFRYLSLFLVEPLELIIIAEYFRFPDRKYVSQEKMEPESCIFWTKK